MLEKYTCHLEGYDPFLIRDGWQVAYLTCCNEHHLDDMVDTEVHKETDEVFILLRGKGVLLTAGHSDTAPSEFEAVNMEKFVTYNIPAGLWHNIAMDEDALIVIIEKSNTHLHDVEHHPFTEEDKALVNKLVEETL